MLHFLALDMCSTASSWKLSSHFIYLWVLVKHLVLLNLLTPWFQGLGLAIIKESINVWALELKSYTSIAQWRNSFEWHSLLFEVRNQQVEQHCYLVYSLNSFIIMIAHVHTWDFKMSTFYFVTLTIHKNLKVTGVLLYP